ncbi:MAG: ABC transporter ATP-binding protein, partial [Planctomycetia bacterium]
MPDPAPRSVPPSTAALLRRLLGLAAGYRVACASIVAQQLLVVAVNLAGLGLMGLAIDVLRHHLDRSAAPPNWPFGWTPPASWPPMAVVGLLAGGMVVVALLHALLKYATAISIARLTHRVAVKLRADVYDKLQRLSFGFFDARQSGSIINRVTGDAQAVRMFIDGVLIEIITVTLSLVVYIVYMSRIHATLTLACLATTPFLWWGSAWFSRRVRPDYMKNRELSDDMVLTLTEAVQGVAVVKGFAREATEIEKFEQANRRLREQKERIFWKISLFQPIMGFLTQVNMMILLGYGGWLAVRGELRLGEGLYVFAGLLNQFANQVAQITNITNTIQTSLTGAERVFEILDAKNEIESPPNPVGLTKPSGRVTFENVSFAYPGTDGAVGPLVLKGIDFEAPAGRRIALVGPTGAGKTTLAALTPRFYDPTEGRVLLDGVDLKRLDLDDLRRSIGVVFQDTFLFSNTVASNIAFGRPDASLDEIRRAARTAAADEFIDRLPDGYDTVVGEYGMNLSGGQRQR